MRRILFPLLVIGLAAGLFTLGSGAFFSDTETDTGNVITAGTLDLQLGTATGACDYSNAAPGATLSPNCVITLNMGGTLNNLHLDMQLGASGIADTCNTEGCNAAANLVASDIQIMTCTWAGGSCPFTFTSGTTTLQDMITEGCVTLDASSDANEDNRTLVLAFRISSGVDNTRQGDGIDITATFGLTQQDFALNRCTLS
jgi:spore coat-associated protein N